jgi:hypothetical protein
MRKRTITEMLAIGQRDLLRVFYAWCFWGRDEELQKFQQAYAVEKARLEAKKRGYTFSEQTLPSGEIKLTIRMEGGAA